MYSQEASLAVASTVDDETADAFGVAIKNERSMETLWSGFAGDAKRRYLSVREQPLESPVLPGVRVHILGPSKDESVIRDLELSSSEPFAQVDPPTSLAEAAGLPFDEGWAKSREVFMSQADFGHLRVSGADRGDHSPARGGRHPRRGGLDRIVDQRHQPDVGDRGRWTIPVLPRRRALGRWDMVVKDPRSRRLLQKALFYKIGHHRSHMRRHEPSSRRWWATNALARSQSRRSRSGLESRSRIW